MSIVKTVYKTVFLKRPLREEALNAGISLEKYSKIKTLLLREVRNNAKENSEKIIKNVERILKIKSSTNNELDIQQNLKDGTKTIGLFSTKKANSPEEIITLLNINIKEWELVHYWNKQRSSGWYVSALVKKIKQEKLDRESFLNCLKNYKTPVIKLSSPTISDEEKVGAVLSLQDLHFGKSNNEGVGYHLLKGVENILTKSKKCYFIENLYLVLGGDALNVDSFNNTTTKGTPVSNYDELPINMYLEAYDSFCKLLILVSKYALNIKVIYIPGNHDRLSSFHLLHVLQKTFANHKNINFDIDYKERKAIRFGNNMLCFEHGDVMIKNNPLIFATEFSNIWGVSKYRVLYTGHTHKRKTTEFITENEEKGFITKVIPALTASDYWHSHKKYIGNNRSTVIDIFTEKSGLSAQFTYTINE